MLETRWLRPSVSSFTCFICLSVLWLISLLRLFSSLIKALKASTVVLSSAGMGLSLLLEPSVLFSSPLAACLPA